MKNKWFIIVAVIFFVFCISWSKSTDFSQDLGRHLKLGEIVVKTHSVPTVNLFSYTNPAFPFINHHWLSEVIYYLLTFAFGRASLFALRFLLLTGAVLFTLKGKTKRSSILAVLFCILVFLPLLLERTEIRPELFGYFFFSLFLYIMFFQKRTRLNYLIPPVMFLWANLHISFVFGLLLLLVGGIQAWRRKQPLHGYFLGAAAVILNPNGIMGAVEPFVIFRNYGYSIIENQSVFFLNAIIINPVLRYYIYLAPLVIIAIITLLSKKQFAGSFILTVFYVAGMWQIRHISFFVFAALFFVPSALEYTVADVEKLAFFGRCRRLPAGWILGICFGILTILICTGTIDRTYDNPRVFGYGFYEEQKEATDYILQHQLPGRIFNNFDIGGYAIYRLYPRYQVFVDNRPEAYPSDFFKNIYIPLQENDELRKQVFQQYGIHTVLYAHTDITPWGKLFVSHILSDPSWKIVFMNSDVFIMSDRTNLPDIRNNTGFFQELIDNADDPAELLHYASFLSSLKQDILVGNVMLKLKTIDPLSCSVKRVDYAMQSSPEYFLNGAVEDKSWWCY